jgi:hypothetical protein
MREFCESCKVWNILQCARTNRWPRWQLLVRWSVVIADITYFFVALFKILLATRQFVFLLHGRIFCSLSLGVAVALLFYVIVYQRGISDCWNDLFPAKSDAPTSVLLYFFHSEYGGSKLFRNVSYFIPFGMASYPRILESPYSYNIAFFVTESTDDNEWQVSVVCIDLLLLFFFRKQFRSYGA